MLCPHFFFHNFCCCCTLFFPPNFFLQRVKIPLFFLCCKRKEGGGGLKNGGRCQRPSVRRPSEEERVPFFPSSFIPCDPPRSSLCYEKRSLKQRNKTQRTQAQLRKSAKYGARSKQGCKSQLNRKFLLPIFPRAPFLPFLLRISCKRINLKKVRVPNDRKRQVHSNLALMSRKEVWKGSENCFKRMKGKYMHTKILFLSFRASKICFSLQDLFPLPVAQKWPADRDVSLHGEGDGRKAGGCQGDLGQGD